MSKLKLILLFILPLTLLPGCAAVVATGVVTGVSVAQDRRSTDAVLDDQGIEYHIGNSLYANKELYNQSHINITSYDGVVLLTGETPNEAFKQEVTDRAKAVAKVKRIHNEVVISEPSAISSISNDSWITSKIKSSLATDESINPFYIKVVTERGVVYLMGIVTQAEADKAVEIAVQTSGVQRVVKIFDISYVEPPAEETAN